MILIYGSTALVMIGLILILLEKAEIFSPLLVVMGIVFLLVTSVSGIVNYNDTKSKVAQYHALKDTIDNARNNNTSEIERAALVTQIAKFNRELADAKYWNETSFDVFIADEFANLEPLK